MNRAFGQRCHGPRVTETEAMPGWNPADRLLDQLHQMLVFSNARNVRLWVFQRENFCGYELGKVGGAIAKLRYALRDFFQLQGGGFRGEPAERRVAYVPGRRMGRGGAAAR